MLFVSVDPWRDRPAVLAAYGNQFTPRVVGLTGKIPELAALTRRYRVIFDRTPPKGEHDAVNHSNAIFAFDGKGRVRLLMREESGVLGPGFGPAATGSGTGGFGAQGEGTRRRRIRMT